MERRKGRGRKEKKKKRAMNGSICMVNAAVRAEEKTRAEKSHRRWRRGKKGAKKARFRRAWRAKKKKERHTVYCVERGRWWSGERRKKRGDGLHKNTGYEMQNQHTLMRGCVSRTSGWKIDTIGHEDDLTRFDSSSFASCSTLPFVFPSDCPCIVEKKES